MTTPEFKTREKFNITGRGDVYVVDVDMTAGEAGELRGQTISLDGEICVVKGVETYAVAADRKVPWIGLIVEMSCDSCGEDMPLAECPKSERKCGHHCNHSWEQDQCCWCGQEFGGDPCKFCETPLDDCAERLDGPEGTACCWECLEKPGAHS